MHHWRTILPEGKSLSVALPVDAVVKMDDIDLQSVRDKLKAIRRADPATAPRRDEEGEPLWDPVVVFESISRGDFRKWLREHEGDLRNWCFEPIDVAMGSVVVYHLPSHVHESTAGAILKIIFEQLVRLNAGVLATLEMEASPTCKLKDRDQEPDGSLTPTETHMTTEFPTLVVEIEYENLSLVRLNQKLDRWMGPETTVQIAIGIKVYKTSRNHVAILRVRGEEPVQVAFGEKKATHPLLPLTFPLSLLYHNAMPEALAGHEDANLSIDLVELRDTINGYIDREEARKIAEAAKHKEEPAQKKRRYFSMKDVTKELATIERADQTTVPSRDKEGEPQWGPVVVCDSISRTAFRTWRSENNGRTRRWWFEPLEEEDTGRVIVYNRPNPIYEAAADWIITNTHMQVASLGSDPALFNPLKTKRHPIYELSDRDQEADASLAPAILLPATEFPTMVVDVEFRNVSLCKLEEKMARWLGPETTIQVAIGIKVNETTRDHVALVCVRGENDDAARIVRSSAESARELVLTFPIDALFRGSVLPPSLVGREHYRVRLDLRQLHVAITNGMEEHHRNLANVEP